MPKKLSETPTEYQFNVRAKGKARSKRFKEKMESEGMKLISVWASKSPDEMPSRLLPDGKINPAYEDWLYHRITALRESGLSWPEVSERLNSDNVLTLRGKKWGRGNAQVFCKRYDERA
jgi:hypothetical protein